MGHMVANNPVMVQNASTPANISYSEIIGKNLPLEGAIVVVPTALSAYLTNINPHAMHFIDKSTCNQKAIKGYLYRLS